MLEIDVAAATAHVLKITATGTGTVHFIEPWLSTAKRIRIANAGVHSTSAQTWAQGSTIYSRSMISLYAPDVVICLLGANDTITGRTAAEFMADLNAVLANAPTVDKIVMSPAPSEVDAEYALMQEYAVRERYQTPHPFIDQLKHFGTYEAAVAAGWITPPDPRHPNATGQVQQVALMAQMLATA